MVRMRSRVQAPIVAPFLFLEQTMLKAAKVLIKNSQGEYLALYRNNHPRFGGSIDLPGGTVEKSEQLEDAAIREVYEEAGIQLTADMLHLIITSRKYSRVGNEYSLYEATLQDTPPVVLSWEHSAFTWLSKEDFIKEALVTNDMFLRMAGDMLQQDEQ